MPDSPDTSGTHLWLVWWKASRAVGRIDRESIREQGFDTLTDFAILEVLLHKGPQPVNTIGRRVLLTSGSITAAVDRAERKGYVERKSSPTDRRVVEVHLTSEGRNVITAAFAQHAQALDEIFDELDEAERRKFYALLKKVGRRAEALGER